MTINYGLCKNDVRKQNNPGNLNSRLLTVVKNKTAIS